MPRFPEWPLFAAGIAIAALLALVGRIASAPGAPRSTIVVTRDAVDRVREARVREFGAASAALSEPALIEAVVDEEILWREGRALLEGGDPVVRRRVDSLRAALAAGRTGEADGGEVDRGEASGDMAPPGGARTDLVLRRYAIEAARLALAGQGSGPPPTDARVDAWASAELARFGRPSRLRFEQRFLSRARRGAALESDAAAMLAALSADPAVSSAGDGSPGIATAGLRRAAPPAAGDSFPVGSIFTGSPAEAERVFGPGFADRVASLPPGRWAGPVASPFGLHLVKVVEVSSPGPARPESVRSRAALALRREAQGRQLRERLAALRAGYDVRVEETADGRARAGS